MIGILALQGGFAKHALALQRLGAPTCYVKRPADLQKCCGLVLPGGESTAMRLHLQRMEMIPALKEFSEAFPTFGTCAGLILMALDLKLLDIQVQRNGFGPQAHSFSHPLRSNDFSNLEGVFIRAPRICAYGDRVQVLADYEGEPVLVRQGRHLAATFHPELTDDLQIHRAFLAMVKGGKFPICHSVSHIESGHAAGEDLPARTQTG